MFAPGKQVVFAGALRDLQPMTILTDLLVDRIYPIVPRDGVEAVARVQSRIVGTRRVTSNGGSLTVLGFRPRDDQSASLGYDARWWFDILAALGAYPATGKFSDRNDNTEVLSRMGDYLVCRFPNGAVAIAPHLRRLEECWPGGFARDRKQDEQIVAQLALPSEQVTLDNFRVNGHTVTYRGERAMAFRACSGGLPIAFCGAGADRITIDGRTTAFANQPMALAAWAPVDAARRVKGGAAMQILVYGAGEVHIPLTDVTGPADLVAQGATPGSRGAVIPSRIEGGVLTFTAGPVTGNWLYVVRR
jgi:hypothetical protein